MPVHYALGEGIHACAVDEAFVVLDILRDKYICLSGDQAYWFSEIINSEKLPLCTDILRYAEYLCDQFLLVRSSSEAPIKLTPQQRFDASIHDRDLGSQRRPSFRHLLVLMWLRVTSQSLSPANGLLADTLAKVKIWKTEARAIGSADEARAIELAQQFHSLAPYCLSSHNACFFTSLLLLRFLSRFGVDAAWTFGVRLSPFEAHCWVSYNGVVLNESCDGCANYQTILTV